MPSENTTSVDIERLRYLYERATPGPWTRQSATGRPDVVLMGDWVWQAVGTIMTDEQPVRDARFIAEMHAVLPALLDELERWRGMT
jgi:hypothetical protein